MAERLTLFSEHWSPNVVKRLNDYKIEVVKIEGEFVWHAHQDNGELMFQLRDGKVGLNPGQLFIVPKGVEHCPIPEGEVHALLIEPADVLNAGEAGGSMTAAYDDTLASPPPQGVGVTALTGQDPESEHDRRARLPGASHPAAQQAGHEQVVQIRLHRRPAGPIGETKGARVGSLENVSWHRSIWWWKHLHRWKWKDVRRHLAGPIGHWCSNFGKGMKLLRVAAGLSVHSGNDCALANLVPCGDHPAQGTSHRGVDLGVELVHGDLGNDLICGNLAAVRGTPLQEYTRLVGVPGHQGKENLRHGMHRFLLGTDCPQPSGRR